jgi:signal transduction histidine kinase/ActR/RegA family two-component response regulator
MSDETSSMDPTERIARLERRVERERTARREAERLLESKSLELFMSNVSLQELAESLERRVEERTNEIRRMQEELRHSQKMEAVGLLAGGVAHDFNNVLMVIGGAAALLPDADAGERGAILAELITAVQRGRELTSRLLAFSRKTAVEEVDIDLSQTVSTFRPLLQRLLTERVTLHVDTPPGLGVRLTRGGLDQLLFNLAANARDAMRDGGLMRIVATPVTLSAGEAVSLQLEPGEYVSIEVSDTGEGMTADTAQRAFDPFFSTKPVGHGNGLGLASVYSLVRQAKGSIALRTAVGDGTTFRVLLPRVPLPVTASSTDADDAPVAPVVGARVLVVDDDPAVRRTVSSLLRRQQFETDEANSAEEALARLTESPTRFDLVVSDVRMPGMNGCDLALALRAMHPTLPVLLVSGFVDDLSVQERIRTAGFMLMGKPFDVPSFLSVVTRTVRSSSHRRPQHGEQPS